MVPSSGWLVKVKVFHCEETLAKHVQQHVVCLLEEEHLVLQYHVGVRKGLPVHVVCRPRQALLQTNKLVRIQA